MPNLNCLISSVQDPHAQSNAELLRQGIQSKSFGLGAWLRAMASSGTTGLRALSLSRDSDITAQRVDHMPTEILQTGADYVLIGAATPSGAQKQAASMHVYLLSNAFTNWSYLSNKEKYGKVQLSYVMLCQSLKLKELWGKQCDLSR